MHKRTVRCDTYAQHLPIEIHTTLPTIVIIYILRTNRKDPACISNGGLEREREGARGKRGIYTEPGRERGAVLLKVEMENGLCAE